VLELLDARDVQLGFRANSVVDAIPLLLRPALARRVDDATAQAIIDAAIKRESEGATMCGALVLPHARTSAVNDFVLTVAANPQGVIAGQAEPRIMFAFVSPASKRQEHLNLLAALARLSQNPGVVRQVVEATTSGRVIEILRGAGI